MDVEREFYKCIAEVKSSGTKDLGTALLNKFRLRLSTLAYPDAVEERSSLFGGLPRLVALKRLPEPVRDCWGQQVLYDEVRVCVGRIVGIVDSITTLVEYPISKEEACKQQYKFLLLTQAEVDTALSLLGKYIYYDFEDIRGPVLGAIVSLGARYDTVDPEWNRLAFMESQRQEAEAALAMQRMLDEETRNLQQAVEQARGLFEVTNYTIYRVDGNKQMFIPTYMAMNIDIKDVGRFTVTGSSASKFIRELGKHREALDRYNKWMHEVIKVRNGTKPLFAIGKVEIYAPKEGTQVNVPENIVPHFIGKGGERIKGFTRILGKKLVIIKTAPVPISRKDAVRYIRFMEKPVFEWRYTC